MAEPSVAAAPRFPVAHGEDDVNLRPVGEVPWYLQAESVAEPASAPVPALSFPPAHGEDDVNLHPTGSRAWYAGLPEAGDSFSTEAAVPAAPGATAAPAQSAPAWYQRVCAWFGE